MSSEVETSLIVNSHLCPAITISGFILRESKSFGPVHRRHEQPFAPDLAAPRRYRREFSGALPVQELIYYEHYRDVRDAIARESQLKKWSRAKKIGMINRLNPTWNDLGADVLQDR